MREKRSTTRHISNTVRQEVVGLDRVGVTYAVYNAFGLGITRTKRQLTMCDDVEPRRM